MIYSAEVQTALSVGFVLVAEASMIHQMGLCIYP